MTEFAAALDEARAEGAMRADQELYKRGLQVGAERERWEIAHLPEMQQSKVARDDDGKPNAWNTQLLIYAAIAARGPMRGPDLEPWQREELAREEANRELANRMRGPEEE